MKTEHSWKGTVYNMSMQSVSDNQVVKHAGGRPKPDKEACRAVASKYQYKSEFRKAEPREYFKAYGQKWLDEFFPVKKPRTKKYSLELCRELAADCSTRREFREKHRTAYHYAYENGWLDDLGLPDRKTTNTMAHRRFSDEEIIRTAKTYKTMSEFRRGHPNVYGIANKRKLLHTFTWLDRNPEVMNGFHDNIYVYEFPQYKVAYVGRTVNPLSRDTEHRGPGDVVYEYAKASGIDVPEPKYIYKKITINEGKVKECEVMSEYRDAGWILLNRKAGGGLGNLRRVSKKSVMKLAKKYEYIYDLRMNDAKTYKALHKYGWFAECDWLKPKSHRRHSSCNVRHGSIWSDYDVCKAEAMKYGSRNEFRLRAGGAFEYAWKQGWVHEWFPNRLNDPRPVGQYDKATGKLLLRHQSVKEAAASLGVSDEAVRSVCLGKNKSCRGFVFKYMKSEDI